MPATVSDLSSSRVIRVGPIAARVALLTILVVATAVALLQLVPPAVVPASAPDTEFSAERAMEHLDVIAQEPHPSGSPAIAEVRAYIIDEIEVLGLEPEVQTAIGITRFPSAEVFNAGTVTNVAVRLPGTANTGAVLLNAHYDAAATGPGASDCGSCVVTLLETLRALRAGPALKNDVIFVFTDAEENGDVGAAAFAAEHPWAQDAAIAINFEAQGAGGPAVLYFTSPGNGWLVNQFLTAVPRTPASSFAIAQTKLVASIQPGCDLEEYVNRGSAGLGFIYLGETSAYHTVRDSVAVIDPRSVQQDGEYALILARHFGNLALTPMPAARDAVFFTLWPGMTITYSHGVAAPIAAGIGVLFVLLVAIGLHRRRLTMAGLAVSALLFLVSVFACLLVVTFVWWTITRLNPALHVFLIGNYQTDLYFISFVALTVAVWSALYLWWQRRFRPADLAAGALFLWAMLMMLTSVYAPDVSYLFTWPLLLGLLSLAWLIRGDSATTHSWRDILVLAVAVVPSILLMVPAVAYPLVAVLSRFEAGTGLPLAGIPMLFVALLLGLLVPHLAFLAGPVDSRKRSLVPATALVIGLAFIGIATLQSGFDDAHPRPNSIAYRYNADTGEAMWVTSDRVIDSWMVQFFPDETTEPAVGIAGATFTAPAPTIDLPAPEVMVLDDTVANDVRTVHLYITSPRGATEADVAVTAEGTITDAMLDGRALDVASLPAQSRNRLQVHYVNVPQTGLELTLSVESLEPVAVIVTDLSSGLPDIPNLKIAPRPADMMPAPGPTVLDPTIVHTTVTLPR